MVNDDHDNSMGSMPTLGDPRAAESPSARSLGGVPTLASAPAPASGRFRIGDMILGRYRVVSELGQGGMGVVYKCFDETAGVEVAVKALPPELSHSPAEMEEVKDNFQLVSRLVHQNIAISKTLERDAASGAYYLVMEAVDGMDLRHWIRVRRRETADSTALLPKVLPVLRQIAAALDYAHSRKIIHRDIKESNVMVMADGTVKVLDFGLADQIRTSLSRVSRAMYGTSGTAPYMAPEQWEGDVQDAATDQYALAAMAYEMLAGHAPFENSDVSVLREIVLKNPPRPVPGLPASAMKALARALAKKRADRFPTCADFVAALGGNNPSPVSAHRKGLLFVPAILFLFLAAIFGGTWFAIRPSPRKLSGPDAGSGKMPPPSALPAGAPSPVPTRPPLVSVPTSTNSVSTTSKPIPVPSVAPVGTMPVTEIVPITNTMPATITAPITNTAPVTNTVSVLSGVTNAPPVHPAFTNATGARPVVAPVSRPRPVANTLAPTNSIVLCIPEGLSVSDFTLIWDGSVRSVPLSSAHGLSWTNGGSVAFSVGKSGSIHLVAGWRGDRCFDEWTGPFAVTGPAGGKTIVLNAPAPKEIANSTSYYNGRRLPTIDASSSWDLSNQEYWQEFPGRFVGKEHSPVRMVVHDKMLDVDWILLPVKVTYNEALVKAKEEGAVIPSVGAFSTLLTREKSHGWFLHPIFYDRDRLPQFWVSVEEPSGEVQDVNVKERAIRKTARHSAQNYVSVMLIRGKGDCPIGRK